MRKEEQKKSKRGERGQAMVEVTLMFPWIFFLFIGILDFGFYAYSAICTENAARVVAMQIAKSQGYSASACALAVSEMSRLNNVAGQSAPCASGTSVSCTFLSCTQPIAVCTGILTKTSTSVCGLPAAMCADCNCALFPTPICDNSSSVKVAIVYQAPTLIPIPGVLTNWVTFFRTAEQRILHP
jgi:hypothetical protein